MGVLKDFLKPLAEDGTALTREQARAVLEEILAGAPEVETAALLTVMATRGEQAPELAGFVDVMRERVTPVPLTDEERAELVDVVGTGGGGPRLAGPSSGRMLQQRNDPTRRGFRQSPPGGGDPLDLSGGQGVSA